MNTSKKTKETKVAAQAAPSSSPAATKNAVKPAVGSKGEGTVGRHQAPRDNETHAKGGWREKVNKEPRDHRYGGERKKGSAAFTKGTHPKSQETGPFARMANPVKPSMTTWGGLGSQMSYADMVRELGTHPANNKNATVETDEIAVKASPPTPPPPSSPEEAKPDNVDEVAGESAQVENTRTPTPAKTHMIHEEVNRIPDAIATPPAIAVAPPPPPSPPQSVPPPAAAYYMLEIDRVESVKLPENVVDRNIDVLYTFSATPGAPPPPQPPALTATTAPSPLQAQAPPPPPPPPPPTHIVPSQAHHLYPQQELLMQRNFGFNPVFQAGGGMPSALGVFPHEWNGRFGNPAGMQYSSHPPNSIPHRPSYMSRVPRDFPDQRHARQNNAGSVW